MAKKSKAQLAARGTVADPTRKDADRLRTEAKQSVGKSAKLVGVMPEDMANEVQATGTVPFTFKSAFLLAGAVLLGTIAIPFFAFQVGVSVGVSTTCAAPMLTAAALAFGRYFVDSKRGLCRGFYLTFLVAFGAMTLICWLLFFKGILV